MNNQNFKLDRRDMLKMASTLVAPYALTASAQTPFAKPIKMMVAFAPGASNDLMGRMLTAEFVKGYAPGSIVENRPGAGGVVAATQVMRSPPDGTTMLIVSFPFPLINSVYKQSKIDVTRDFLPVATLCTTPNLVAVRADSPYKTLQELITAAKQQPGTISFASTGNGTSPHMGMELIMQQTGTKFVHVPYKGSAPATTDLLAGQVDFTVDNLSNALANIRAGKMRALAVTSSKRSPVLPDIPTLAEAGVPNVVMNIWIGVVTVADTPASVIQSHNTEINRILDLKETRDRFTSLGIEVLKSTPEYLGKLINEDVVKWGKVVHDAKITVE